MSGGVWQITFAPVVPWMVLIALGVVALGIVGYSLFRDAGGVSARTIGFAVLLLALANPRHVEERREAETDIALLVVDRTASQAVGERQAQTDAAAQLIRDRLAEDPGIELREIEVSRSSAGFGRDAGGTALLGPLARAAAGIPASRYAGAVVITDGQVHDVPAAAESTVGTTRRESYGETLPDGPLHVLIAGEKDSFDRRILIETVPAYAIVGKPFEITYRVVDSGVTEAAAGDTPLHAELRVDGVLQGRETILNGASGSFEVSVDHAGVSVIEVTTPAAEGELSTINNSAVATVNGVRDRLRVLLVSGQPHAGERTWRNLLKSDPAVDLIHFTILRPPDKSDFTPIRELALITFPTFELFELKLKEFDLVVFDRYVVRFVLSPLYFRNIRDFVTEGGAVMLAVGPEYAGHRSLYDTPLGEIAPARPVGGVIEQPFRPSLTEAGNRHPVTAGLGGRDANWGRWLRQIPVVEESGDVLMRGAEDLPLLVLSRVGEGRIGFLASDQVWLWARDFDGGGPHAELIRRTAHWLMREPALEEESLSAELDGDQIRVTRRTLSEAADSVVMRRPDGVEEILTLEQSDEGRFSASTATDGPGVYRFDDGEYQAHLAVGDVDPVEYRDLRATEEILTPLSVSSGGASMWLNDGVPDLRRPKQGRDMAGRDWIGLRTNESYIVTGLSERPLLPGWLVALLVVGTLMAAWWWESRTGKHP
ncbi:MAG: hypothetical protein RIC16_08305 [Rhodospirillales bacterium]